MTPGHRKLAAWYQQLGQHLNAGLPLTAAIRSSSGAAVPNGVLERMAGAIEAGGSAADALRSAGVYLPQADVIALTAAAETGRMPRMLDRLATRHAQLGAAKLRLALACAYPLAILHFALLLLPVVRMIDWEKGFHWSAGAYLRGAAATIGPLWIAGVVIWILARRKHPAVQWIATSLPAFRGYVRQQSLADFAFALGNFLEAGVPIAQAWATAGLVTSSRELKSAARAMEATALAGALPGREISRWSCFPADFVALYRTGETTGQLDTNLLQLAAQKQEAAHRALGVATVIYPLFLFIAIAAGAAFFVISIYAGYLKMLVKLAE